MSRPFKCPFCGSHRNVRKGVRVTKTMGIRKLRRCKDCGRKFTPKNQLLAESTETGDVELIVQPEPDTTPETNLEENCKLLPNANEQQQEQYQEE